MPTFEFDDGPNIAGMFLTSITDQVVATVDEDGSMFTWSVTSDGSVGFVYRADTDNGQFFLSNTSSLQATWSLDVQAPGETDLFGGSFAGAVSVAGNFQSGLWDVTFHGTTVGQNVVHTGVTGSQTLMATSGSYTNITFTETSGMGGLTLDSLTAGSITCYCAGTRIATPDGYQLVENLVAGDTVLTAHGTAVPVQWLGVQTVDTQFSNPATVNPICITAGALDHSLPDRDLWVSPDHAIEIDGVLINASALNNSTSIYTVQDMPKDGFTYYHVECEHHELLLAEGVPAESYLDMNTRATFDNGDARADAPVTPEMALPRISAARLVPKSIVERIAQADPSKIAA